MDSLGEEQPFSEELDQYAMARLAPWLVRAGSQAGRTAPAAAGSNNYLQKILQIKAHSGNFNIGGMTSQEALALGETWVGKNAVPIVSQGQLIGFRSVDNLKVFRLPVLKQHGIASGKVQANIVEQVLLDNGKYKVIRNGHIDIIP
ncbi:hypothetical protein D3C72_1935260 [compost metagenome]